ncbi:hypothetical protein E4J66_11955 [Actinomyces viscosus]|nr:hypothetical protein E4J66_11955 [Actinomyces viscosus]
MRVRDAQAGDVPFMDGLGHSPVVPHPRQLRPPPSYRVDPLTRLTRSGPSDPGTRVRAWLRGQLRVRFWRRFRAWFQVEGSASYPSVRAAGAADRSRRIRRGPPSAHLHHQLPLLYSYFSPIN